MMYRRGRKFEARGGGVFVHTPAKGEIIEVPAIVPATEMPTHEEARRYLLTAGRVVGGEVIHFSGEG